MTLCITRKLEFDAGHRIPDHNSQCRHLHGHRYVLEITLTGEVIHNPGAADNGIILDFSDVKTIAQKAVIEKWDHAFLVFQGDQAVLSFLNSLPNHKTVVLHCIPTAENLAAEAFEILAPLFAERYGKRLSLSHVRLYETPNCWADVHGTPTP